MADKIFCLFSEGEREFLRLLIDEMDNNQIADALDISPETGKTYRNNILRNAGLSITSQLVSYYMYNG